MSRITETKSNGKRTPPVWVSICAGLLFLSLIVLSYFRALTQPLATVLLGSLALIVALWRSFIAEQQANAAREQAKTATDSQVTERFSRAIEQLGTMNDPGNISVRLGGIYALEKIAQDFSEDYHWTVMEVLCSFLREHSRGRPKGLKGDLPTEINKARAPADIQASLTVLGRRNTDAEREDQRLDLREANFSLAEFRNAKLNGAYLHETDFRMAVFSWAELRGAICFNADFKGANLSEADLSGAKLGNADLSGAVFTGTDLRAADLGRANLRKGADLQGAKNLTQPQVDSAYGDETTRLPDGIKRPDHWIKPQESEEP